MSDEAQVPPTPPSSTPPPPPSSPPPSAAPPPAAGGGGGPASENRQLWIVLSYIWLLALIPFLIEKEDREVQWHAKHGLVLLVAEVIVWVTLAILGMVLGPVGCFVAVLNLVIFVAVLIVHILCIVKGIGGQRFLIPGISQYADRF